MRGVSTKGPLTLKLCLQLLLFGSFWVVNIWFPHNVKSWCSYIYPTMIQNQLHIEQLVLTNKSKLSDGRVVMRWGHVILRMEGMVQ